PACRAGPDASKVPLGKRDLPLDLQHAVVATVADIQRPVLADGDAVRLAQLGLLRRLPEARSALLAGPRHADDLAVLRSVAADQVVLGVGDDHAAVGIDAQVLRPVERRPDRVAAVAGRAGHARAGHRANLPLRIDNAQRVPR